jgi:hypothetical protein
LLELIARFKIQQDVRKRRVKILKRPTDNHRNQYEESVEFGR